MSLLYPLRLEPEFYERIWGTTNLSPIYSRPVAGQPIGEAWLTGEKCRVVNGPLSGQTLSALTRQFGAELVGEAAPDPSRFPLLIKFLFPTEKLSVQVHPDDESAARIGQPCGKTECWYILRAEPGAQIGLGLKPGTTKAEVEAAIRETRMEHLLNWIDVKAGDLIYVDAGTVHTIGPGAVIVETQQNSDTTFRLYDYGRPRELHIHDGLQAAKMWTHAGRVQKQQPQVADGKSQVNLVSSPCFVVDKFKLQKPWEFHRPGHAKRSAWCLVAIAGSSVLSSEGSEPISVNCGDAVVLPAAVDRFTLKPQWETPPQNAQQRRAPGTPEIEFLCSSVPAEKLEHPRTVLVENIASVAP
jgi:mannose-6-phosphate isomerase